MLHQLDNLYSHTEGINISIHFSTTLISENLYYNLMLLVDIVLTQKHLSAYELVRLAKIKVNKKIRDEILSSKVSLLDVLAH